MSALLANRVRGETVPVNGGQLRLLEVIVDSDRTPYWRARCLQTGKLATVALDGFVQAPVSRPADAGKPHSTDRREGRRRFRLWAMLAGGLGWLAVFRPGWFAG